MGVTANKTIAKQRPAISLKIADYVSFTKMRLSLLVVFSAVFGYLIAAPTVDFTILLLLIIGGYLVTGASNGFNQIIERDLDKLMKRTKNRPLPTGRMSLTEAYITATVMGAAGILLLYFGINPLCGVLGALALFLYVLIYTPLKRISPIAVFVGAFPGSIPPMLGWVAYSGHFGLAPGLLFAVQFMWQFPHFWAIAWKADEDYAKAGFKLLPSKSGKSRTSALIILVYALFTIPISFLPAAFGIVKMWTIIPMFLIGMGFSFPAIKLYFKLSEKSATRLMFYSFAYLPLALVILYVGKFF